MDHKNHPGTAPTLDAKRQESTGDEERQCFERTCYRHDLVGGLETNGIVYNYSLYIYMAMVSIYSLSIYTGWWLFKLMGFNGDVNSDDIP